MASKQSDAAHLEEKKELQAKALAQKQADLRSLPLREKPPRGSARLIGAFGEPRIEKPLNWKGNSQKKTPVRLEKDAEAGQTFNQETSVGIGVKFSRGPQCGRDLS